MKRIISSLLILAMLCSNININKVEASEETFKSNVFPKEKTKYTLAYDDRLEFETNVEAVETVKVESNKVGSEEKDDAVVKIDPLNSDRIIAVGCGKALVTLDTGDVIKIKVKPAKISLCLMVGQSNMEGSPSNKDIIIQYQQQFILNEEGTVYNTYGPSNAWHARWLGNFGEKAAYLEKGKADEFVPDSLTDNSAEEGWKHTNNITDAPGALGKTGIDSAFADEWYDNTKEKIWVVNAAHAGSSITSWDPSKSKNNNFWESVELYKACERLLNKEIKAGHYKLGYKGYMWMQGEEDYNMSFESYLKYFTRMHKMYEKELKGDKSDSKYKKVTKDLDFGGIIMVRAHKKPTSLIDLLLTGPRKALYYICQQKTGIFKNVFLASQLSEVWTSNKNVKKYFVDKYGGNKKYSANNFMRSVQLLPTTLKEIHYTIHYSQLGYNEIGKDAAKNLLYSIGAIEKPKNPKVKIELVSEDGYTDISEVGVDTDMTILAKVFPTYLNKELSVSYNSSSVSYKYLNAIFNTSTMDTVSGNAAYSLKFSVNKSGIQYTP
ncbi:MAG: hypothetical protein K6G11_03585 [Lachnospiraceae bacterium]|nr:hypothetical protein [Lachnospiraceae bacterium]